MSVVKEQTIAPKYVQTLMEASRVDVTLGISWTMMRLHVMVRRRNNYNTIIRIAYIILLYIIYTNILYIYILYIIKELYYIYNMYPYLKRLSHDYGQLI